MSHTSGPWDIAQDAQGNFCIYGGPSINAHAVVYNVDYRKQESIDNARLIAAAPELLEALEVLARAVVVDENISNTMIAALDIAEAAVAKARGEA